MTSPPLVLGLDRIIRHAYLRGQTLHGDLSVPLEQYESYLIPIIEKRFGLSEEQVLPSTILKTLYLEDLYLSIACAEASEIAWRKFAAIYGEYIRKIALYVCTTGDQANELSSSVMADLYMPDRAGRSRIAGYDGRISLASWLRVVIKNRAINMRERKCNSDVPLESVIELASDYSTCEIEISLRAKKYGAMIRESFSIACRNLTNRERFILVMRFDEGLKANKIAEMLGMNQIKLSREIRKIEKKLHDSVIANLSGAYGLSDAVVQECLVGIVENP